MTHLDVAGLLFDNDGVLVDSVASGNEAWTQWAGEHDLDPAHVLELVHGRRAADTVAALLPADRVAVATDRINALELSTAGTTVALPGALALLTSLVGAGLPWAVATSATRPLALARLEAAGLPVPEVLVTADDVERGKPAPDPYAEAAARLGLDPADCVVLEDSPAGVGPAWPPARASWGSRCPRARRAPTWSSPTWPAWWPSPRGPAYAWCGASRGRPGRRSPRARPG